MAWFAAKVRYKAQRPGTRRPLHEDSVFVFRARSTATAERRAEAIARAMVAERVETDDEGRKIRWQFDRLHDVLDVGPAGLVDGAEIWREGVGGSGRAQSA